MKKRTSSFGISRWFDYYSIRGLVEIDEFKTIEPVSHDALVFGFHVKFLNVFDGGRVELTLSPGTLDLDNEVVWSLDMGASSKKSVSALLARAVSSHVGGEEFFQFLLDGKGFDVWIGHHHGNACCFVIPHGFSTTVSTVPAFFVAKAVRFIDWQVCASQESKS